MFIYYSYQLIRLLHLLKSTLKPFLGAQFGGALPASGGIIERGRDGGAAAVRRDFARKRGRSVCGFAGPRLRSRGECMGVGVLVLGREVGEYRRKRTSISSLSVRIPLPWISASLLANSSISTLNSHSFLFFFLFLLFAPS